MERRATASKITKASATALTVDAAGMEMTMSEQRELPRRCYIDLYCPAELAIRNAVLAVEEMPADVRLTDAVVLLSQAKDKVADFIDGVGL